MRQIAKIEMKKIIFIFSILIWNYSYSQTNLVPNPSFETYSSCPNSLDQLNKCQGWSSFRASPDYFNKCSSTNGIFPPSVGVGYQEPFDGNAYVGIATYDNSGFGPNYREIIGCQLVANLTVGIKYFFSFYVSYSGVQAFELATNNLGIKFSKNQFSVSTPVPILNTVVYSCPQKVVDSLNWVKISGSFISDSTYQYMMLGNFFDDANTDTISTGQYNQQSYYFIDKVALSSDSLLGLDVSVIETADVGAMQIFPNPTEGLVHFRNLDRDSKIQIYNISGLRILEFAGERSTIDLSSLNNGVYIIKIKSDTNSSIRRLIINK